MIDLATPNIVNETYQLTVINLAKDISMSLELLATVGERELLIKLSKCKSIAEVVSLYQGLPITGPGSATYLSLALHKL